MKTISIIAALAATFTVTIPAFAQETAAAASAGHYEWRAQPQYGPRAPLRAPVRVWVPANAAKNAKAADCDCAMMHGSAEQADDCMKMGMSAS